MAETLRQPPTPEEIEDINRELAGAEYEIREHTTTEAEAAVVDTELGEVFGEVEGNTEVTFPDSITPANNPEVPMFNLHDLTKPVSSSEQGADQKGGDVGAAS